MEEYGCPRGLGDSQDEKDNILEKGGKKKAPLPSRHNH